MRKILPVIAFLLLASCATGTSAVDQAIGAIKSLCGFYTTDTEAIGTLVAAADTTGSIAPYLAVAKLVCDQVKPLVPKITESAAASVPITVTVNGVKVTGHF